MDDQRIARRRRIDEIFSSVWDPGPDPDPDLGRALTPEDHLRTVSLALGEGTASEDNFIVQEVARKRGAEVAIEYARLLREEASAQALDARTH